MQNKKTVNFCILNDLSFSFEIPCLFFGIIAYRFVFLQIVFINPVSYLQNLGYVVFYNWFSLFSTESVFISVESVSCAFNDNPPLFIIPCNFYFTLSPDFIYLWISEINSLAISDIWINPSWLSSNNTNAPKFGDSYCTRYYFTTSSFIFSFIINLYIFSLDWI